MKKSQNRFSQKEETKNGQHQLDKRSSPANSSRVGLCRFDHWERWCQHHETEERDELRDFGFQDHSADHHHSRGKARSCTFEDQRYSFERHQEAETKENTGEIYCSG